MEDGTESVKKRALAQFGKSFIYNKNKRGPKTDPWGTPQRMGLWSEVTFPMDVNCFLSFK